MTSPEVSVVIPTCCRPTFLRDAIGSVEIAAGAAELAIGSLEINVVDDGHCDQSRMVCEELQAKSRYPLNYLRTKGGPREGPGAARNQGVRASMGRFIYLIDDDDQFLENRFKRSLPLLKSDAYDAVLERTIRVFADGSNRASYVSGPDDHVPGGPVETIKYMMSVDKTGHITPGATSFRKDMFLRLGGQDEKLRFGEDGEFLLRLGLFGRVAFLAGDPVAAYFFHSRNSSRAENLQYYQSVQSLSHFYRNTRGAKADARRFVRRVIAQKLDYVLTAYRRESPTYLSRLRGGTAALWFYPWDCLTWNNLKSVGVWLLKGRNA